MFLIPMGTDLKINNQPLLIFLLHSIPAGSFWVAPKYSQTKKEFPKLYFFPFLEHCFRDKDKRSLIGRRPDLNIMHADYLSG